MERTTTTSNNLGLRVVSNSNATTMTLKNKLILEMKEHIMGQANTVMVSRTGIKGQTLTTMVQGIRDTAKTKGTIKVSKDLATAMIRTKVGLLKKDDSRRTKIVERCSLSTTISVTDLKAFNSSQGSKLFKTLKLVRTKEPSQPRKLN
jgi:hypothetical protein